MDQLLATGHIALWLLIAGLFFPRLALFVAWLGSGTYPPNTLLDLLNFVSWLFFPRFLMAYYIYVDMGTNNLWFWAYLVTGVVGFFGESGFVHRRIIRRTQVTRNGETTTTVEEEVSRAYMLPAEWGEDPMASVRFPCLLQGMTTIVEKDSSGLAAVLDYPSSKGVQTLCDCISGGYSVWNCPPPRESKLPTPAKKTP